MRNDEPSDLFTKARRKLVVATCLSVAGAVIFMILFWVLSGSLEDIETVFAGAVLVLILGGIAWLANRGKVRQAAWMLIILLSLIISSDLPYYGIGSPTAASYVIPIALAGCTLGLWAALAVTSVGTAMIWIVAWGTTSGGWFDPPAPIDHLTFNAPALTIILVVTALIIGLWVHSTTPRN